MTNYVFNGDVRYMTSIIKKLMLIVYIIISFIVLFNMYNNKYYSFNNKMIFDSGIKRSYTDFDAIDLEIKKYYNDITTKDDEYTFSFHRDYCGNEYEQETKPDYSYFGTVILKQNSTSNIKCIYDLWEKLDSYVEFVANNKIRINGDIYLDIEKDGYIYKDEEIKIGNRYIYLVVVPFLILLVFNLPCIGISILIDFGLIIEMISSLYF